MLFFGNHKKKISDVFIHSKSNNISYDVDKNFITFGNKFLAYNDVQKSIFEHGYNGITACYNHNFKYIILKPIKINKNAFENELALMFNQLFIDWHKLSNDSIYLSTLCSIKEIDYKNINNFIKSIDNIFNKITGCYLNFVIK